MSVLNQEQKESFVFKKQNYTIIITGVIVELLGMLLMIGGDSEDPAVFNEEVFSPQRITIAPILIITGLIIVMYGIMKKPKAE